MFNFTVQDFIIFTDLRSIYKKQYTNNRYLIFNIRPATGPALIEEPDLPPLWWRARTTSCCR